MFGRRGLYFFFSAFLCFWSMFLPLECIDFFLINRGYLEIGICGDFCLLVSFSFFTLSWFFNLIDKEEEGSWGLATSPASLTPHTPQAGGPAGRAWLHGTLPPGQGGLLSPRAQGPGTPSCREASTIWFSKADVEEQGQIHGVLRAWCLVLKSR